MKILGVDPGSARTGYGCIESDGSRHLVLVHGAFAPPARASFPEKLLAIHDGLAELLQGVTAHERARFRDNVMGSVLCESGRCWPSGMHRSCPGHRETPRNGKRDAGTSIPDDVEAWCQPRQDTCIILQYNSTRCHNIGIFKRFLRRI